MRTRSLTVISLGTLASLTMLTVGCNNNGIRHRAPGSVQGPGSGLLPPVTQTEEKTEQNPAPQGDPGKPQLLKAIEEQEGIRLQFSTNLQQKKISDLCLNQPGCLCSFDWMAPYPTSDGKNTEVSRSAQSKIVSLQDNTVFCSKPASLEKDIGDMSVGTHVRASVMSQDPNLDLGLNSVSFTRGGEVQEVQAESLRLNDIHRYACFENRKRPLLRSKVAPDGRVLASQFDLSVENQENADSAQSHYFNLYTSSLSSVADLASGGALECVQSPNRYGVNATYPDDSTFSLINRASAQASIKVQSFLPIDGGGLESITLGYAAKPDANGSCGSAVHPDTGESLKTYRLRRYVAVMRPFYDSHGFLKDQTTTADIVYSIDRPIIGDATATGLKPCPSAYLDSANVTGQGKGYRATFDESWNATNIDNVHLPNTDFWDRDSNKAPSCAAMLMLPSSSSPGGTIDGVTLVTAHAARLEGTPRIQPLGDGTHLNLGKVYVRPVRPWAPTYVEDLSFEACAPLAKNAVEPAMHFVQAEGGAVRGCAEVYPDSSTRFEGALYSTAHGSAGPHSIAGSGNTKPPLLASQEDIEKRLASDPQYTIRYTSKTRAPASAKFPPLSAYCPTAHAAGAGSHWEPHGESTDCLTR